MSKSLILSLENNNYYKEKDILLAGEWVLENRETEVDKKNYEIFYSKSDKKSYRKINCLNSDKIYENIIVDLSKELNSLHSVSLSSRAWNIIFGNWLKHFINICYERNYLLFEILERYKIKNIYGIQNDNFKFCSDDTRSIYYSSSDEIWNNNFFYEILNYYDLPVEKNFKKIHNLNEKDEHKLIKKRTPILKSLTLKFFGYLKFFIKKNDAVITGTHMPFFYEKLLESSYLQVPQIYNPKQIFYEFYNEDMRSRIKLPYSSEKNIDNFIRKKISKFLPICFVESFKNIYENCEKNFPSNPKFILTGYAFEHDENFKFYTAKKTSNKTPYYVLQHGNTYLVEDFVLNRCEYKVTNKFFTFGYGKKSFTKPFCNQITLGKSLKYKKEGLLHVIVSPLLNRVFSYDRSQEFNKSLRLVYEFEKQIDQRLKDKILLRLNGEYFKTKRGKWLNKKYFKNFQKNQIDYGIEKSYMDNLKNSRINLFFYDSTGILENLIYNVPTIGIWPNQYNHIEDEFVEKYKFLKNANIIFDDLSSMINHLNNIWEDVGAWWFSDETQDNISNFNKDFNKKGNLNSVFKLKNYINNSLNS